MFFLFYLAFGASIFSAIEAPLEVQVKKDLIERKREFLRRFRCLSGEQNYTCFEKLSFQIEIVTFSDDALEDFMMDIVYANDRGVSIFKNGTSVPSWSFGQSFFFSSTVVTTIGKCCTVLYWLYNLDFHSGYGHQTPLSDEGKVFCILYALFGIPMTMLLLAAVVERCLIPVNLLLKYMMGRLMTRMQPFYIFGLHFGLVCSS